MTDEQIQIVSYRLAQLLIKFGPRNNKLQCSLNDNNDNLCIVIRVYRRVQYANAIVEKIYSVSADILLLYTIPKL